MSVNQNKIPLPHREGLGEGETYQKTFYLIKLRTALLSAFIAFATFADAPITYAQQHTAAEQPAAEEEKAPIRPTLDLGDFKINDLRPTRNETARLTFKMHLALSPEVTEKQLAQLEHWKHRLRNQVIIAVRTIHTKDFQAADLALLRRIIRIRTNRMLKANLVQEALLTEYLFRLY